MGALGCGSYLSWPERPCQASVSVADGDVCAAGRHGTVDPLTSLGHSAHRVDRRGNPTVVQINRPRLPRPPVHGQGAPADCRSRPTPGTECWWLREDRERSMSMNSSSSGRAWRARRTDSDRLAPPPLDAIHADPPELQAAFEEMELAELRTGFRRPKVAVWQIAVGVGLLALLPFVAALLVG